MADVPDDERREASFPPRTWPRAIADGQQRLKAALWFAIGKMVDEESMDRNRNATAKFIAALTEVVWTQLGRNDIAAVRVSTSGIRN